MEKKKSQMNFLIKKEPLICIVILFLCACIESNKYQEILDDKNYYSYYVSLNIIYDNQQMRIVIENAKLLYILKKEKDVTPSMYNKQMEKIFDKNIPLKVNKNVFLLLSQYQVIPSPKIDSLKKYGINNLIKSLFNEHGALIAPSLSNMEERYVIDILFQNNIFTKIDDESGYVYIPDWHKIKW